MDFIKKQLELFVQNCESLKTRHYRVSQQAEYIYRVEPESYRRSAKSADKDIPLTLLALTHGVEVAGLGVLNEILLQMQSGLLTLSYPVCFALGNPWAALAGQRFLERDLNRSFACGDQRKLKEERRALELEAVIRRTEWFFDIHQTKEFSPQPFFIFPFSKAGFGFARQVAPTVPIVTRKGGAFSKEGMCSDEFANAQGGAGITIELGQNGFTAMGMGVGVAACLRAIRFVAQQLTTGPKLDQFWEAAYAPVFTWAAVMDYPDSGEVSLRDDLTNFMIVREKESLGTHNGNPIPAAASGQILFPQHYRDRTQPRPKELVRILREMPESEIAIL